MIFTIDYTTGLLLAVLFIYGVFMAELISLISGSTGNSSLLASGKTNILIDCGTSGKKLEEALKAADIMPQSISAMLITHEHSDHVRGAGIIARKYGIPVYATAPTHKAMNIGTLTDEQIKTVSPDNDFEIGDIGITPFAIPHDAAAPVGYCFCVGNERFAVATDIGCMSEYIKSHLYGCSDIILESNHDVELLRIGPYPYPLKRRILSDVGHLSNKSAAQTALELTEHGTRHIMLGHLSEHNNRPEIAVMETFNMLTGAGVEVGKDVTLQVADRYSVTRFEK